MYPLLLLTCIERFMLAPHERSLQQQELPGIMPIHPVDCCVCHCIDASCMQTMTLHSMQHFYNPCPPYFSSPQLLKHGLVCKLVFSLLYNFKYNGVQKHDRPL